MISTTRSGTYFRVADPAWAEPLDGSYARDRGGRWNPPSSFAVVYLNATHRVARANVLRLLAGQPYGPEDLDPGEAPLLVVTEVPRAEYVDIVTDEGCEAAGLPPSYPRDEDGSLISYGRCQPIGQAAFDGGEPGIACRSAAPGTSPSDEELAWYERTQRLSVLERRPFDVWFWSD